MNTQAQGTTLLAIDDMALPFRSNVCYYISKPGIRPEPVLAPSPLESNAPDNSGAHFYGTVLHDGGRFRMWYYACHYGKNPDWPSRMMQQIAKPPGYLPEPSLLYQGPLCYAQSDDGIHWTKPALGQVLFKGSRANNALALPHNVVSGAAVVKDEDDLDPSRRYKMVYQFFPDQTEPVIAEYGTVPTVALAVSPDGFQWTVTGIPFRNQFVEHASFIRHDDAYIIHFQAMQGLGGLCSEGGASCGRTGVARMTYDFEHWPDLWCEAFALPEPRAPHQRHAWKGTYDQVHLGVGAAGFGSVCVGLYGIWHNAEDFGAISGDLGLVVSNNGLHFREPVKGHVFIHRNESPAAPVSGRTFNTVLTQGNGLLNVGDTTYLYHGRWRNVGHLAEDQVHYSGEVALATLPRDRWGALGLNPEVAAGTICSAPVTGPATGCQLRINADGVAGLTVDLLDERLQPIPGFTGGRVTGPDGLACPIRWPDRAMAELGRRPVRVQVRLQRVGEAQPRVYAIYLGEDAA